MTRLVKTYAIIGSGGLGREVFPIAAASLAREIEAGATMVFAVEDGYPTGTANGHRVVTIAQLISDFPRPVSFAVAIADGPARARITALCKQQGMMQFEIRAPESLVMEGSTIGPGAILAPFTMVTANSTIGESFHLNYYACVTHDCVIGDFVTFGPRVQCNGNVIIEDGVFVGAGAIIKQGTPEKPLVIGRGATIGMGAVVTRSVPADMTVVGNPARAYVKPTA